MHVDSDNDSAPAENDAKKALLNAGTKIMPSADNKMTLSHSHHIDCLSIDALQTDFIADKSASQMHFQYISDVLFAIGMDGWRSAEESSLNIRENILNNPASVASSDLVLTSPQTNRPHDGKNDSRNQKRTSP